jgi:hypothetical protein
MAVSQGGRRKRALTREAVGSGLNDAIREMGMTEDVIRDEARESGAVKGGGIRKIHKADVAIYRGIKMDSVPAWANYGRGRGVTGARGSVRGARGGSDGSLPDGQGRGSGAGARGRGESRGRGGGRGRGKSEGRGGEGTVGARSDRGRGGGSDRGRKSNNRRGRGGIQPFLSGSNLSDVDAEAPDRKRKLTEDKATDPKKVKLMQRASPSAPSASSSSP